MIAKLEDIHLSESFSYLPIVADEKWGERPMLLVVTRDGGKLSAGEIANHLPQFVDQDIIEKWAVPDRIEFVDAIDKTSVGKIDKKKRRARYGGI